MRDLFMCDSRYWNKVQQTRACVQTPCFLGTLPELTDRCRSKELSDKRQWNSRLTVCVDQGARVSPRLRLYTDKENATCEFRALAPHTTRTSHSTLPVFIFEPAPMHQSGHSKLHGRYSLILTTGG
ncbi:hypothetical protein DPEC_G00137640 [Dallia pectoralis]|uniref:Uncharacterized protein n=1 Tax=Dallia pectoralis TaxID=75939 RepID=A0ACC2GLQ0_DALPE|nr:hypothetical protein DPEC_G00137640 [Dallia pectoralis]